MGRDLLYKPAVPQQLPDEQSVEKAGEAGKAGKLGVKGPSGRDLGGVSDSHVRLPAGSTPRVQQVIGAQAHKAAYFNKDISGLKEVNQRASNMQALRGGQGATDLKKIVLPPAIGIDNPDPEQLAAASALMGLDGSIELDLESLLGRQGAWARGQGVTAEMLLARMQQLEEMVAARKEALRRMNAAGADRVAGSVTVSQASTANGEALDNAEDVVAEGRELVERTAAQAEGMHYRLAKMLGIKRSK
ncbi:MAG: hypothetical protein V3T05_06590 [Myxococcota bacterium]